MATTVNQMYADMENRLAAKYGVTLQDIRLIPVRQDDESSYVVSEANDITVSTCTVFPMFDIDLGDYKMSPGVVKLSMTFQKDVIVADEQYAMRWNSQGMLYGGNRATANPVIPETANLYGKPIVEAQTPKHVYTSDEQRILWALVHNAAPDTYWCLGLTDDGCWVGNNSHPVAPRTDAWANIRAINRNTNTYVTLFVQTDDWTVGPDNVTGTVVEVS